MTLQHSITALTGIFVLAFLAETLTEYLLSPWLKPQAPDETDKPAVHMVGNDDDEKAPIQLPRYTLRYAAALVGVVLCVVYAVDALALLGLSSGWPIVGYIVTGLVVGRGSNFVHDFADRWLA
jgi:hypothetical protein